MKTKRKLIKRRRNPTVTLDDIYRISGNVIRDLWTEEGIQGIVLRKGKDFEVQLHNGKSRKLHFSVNKDENGFLVFDFKGKPVLVNENGDDVYLMLENVFSGRY